MVIINVIDGEKFSFNGKSYPRIYQALAQGTDGLAIHNVYDVKQQLLGPTHYTEIQIDGVVQASRDATLDALVSVLYASEGAGTGTTGETITNINQIPFRSYNDLQDLPALGGEVTVVDTNDNIQTYTIATVNGQAIKETVTELKQPTLTGNVLTLKLLNELYEEQAVSIDLSNITTQSAGLIEAGYNATTNKITIVDRELTEYVLDLSGLTFQTEVDENGVVSVIQDGIVRATISKVGESGEFTDILNLPTTLSGYGITDAYTIAEVDALLNDKADLAGYNNVQWDQAVAWGDHSQEGYLKSETVTRLNQPVIIGNILTLKFQNELGVEQTTQIDLSSIVGSNTTSIDNAGYDPATQIITITNPDTTEYEIDLKKFIVNKSTDADGITTLTQNGNGIITVAKVGQSGQYADLLGKPVIPTVPVNLSAFNNDPGYITGVNWNEVVGKPSTFTPTAHNHDDRYYTQAEMDAMLQGTTVEGHTHTVSDILDFPVIPTATSDLTNDIGYITQADVPAIPTNISAFNNDSGYLTALPVHTHAYSDLTGLPSIPERTSDLLNDTGFITEADIPAIPTNISSFINDVGYITDVAWSDVTEKPVIPTATSQLTNDTGFLTSLPAHTHSAADITSGILNKDRIFGINVKDTRSVNDNPELYNREVKFEFKLRTTIEETFGIQDYSPVMTLAPWSDDSGGARKQMAFGEDVDGKPVMSLRTGTEANGWYPWYQMWHSGNLTDVSQLNNDAGYLTSAAIPSNVSELTNDAGYITTAELPTNTSELINDSNFVTSSAIPVNVSELVNDAGYLTEVNGIPVHTHDYSEITNAPQVVSDLPNDAGYLTADDVSGQGINQDNKIRVITAEINYLADMNEAGYVQWINDNPITQSEYEVIILDFVYKPKEQYEIEIVSPTPASTIYEGTNITIELEITDTTTV